MARQLAKNVYVGEKLYMAGSTPPKDVAEQITNPAAWGDGDAKTDPAPAPADPPAAPPAGGDDDVVDYNDTAKFKADDLEKLAADRGLDVKGTGANDKVLKKDLVAALEADDAAKK
jgi:pyruvate/2-oxoglutarate dehydrogenase complex dihydrolipoamide acyltransferase (E2) component